MNEIIASLVSRRSVKSYAPRQVERELLEQVVTAGAYAACGMGRQAGKIVVLQDAEQIAALERMNAEILGAPGSHPFYGAPTVCVIFADSSVPTCVEDGSLVIGNMLNAAHALGLGSCWVHRARQEFETPEGRALMKKWGVDESYIGIGHCLLGYAAREPSPARARKPDFVVYA